MRKYRPGPKVTSLNELMEQEFVYWNKKITHHSWFCNWRIHMAEHAIKAGIIRLAIKNEKDGN